MRQQMHQRHLTRSTQFSQGKTQTTQGCAGTNVVPATAGKMLPRSYLLLMQPGTGAPSTVPHTSPGTWASRAALTRGYAHPAVALCPMEAYSAAFCNVISTKSHPTTFPAAVTAQTKDFASWTL